MYLYRVPGPGGRPVWAVRESGRYVSAELPDRVRRLAAETAQWVEPGEDVGPVDGVDPLPPSRPSKVVCVGRNYRKHAEELGNPIPEEPLIFLKPSSAIIGTGTAIQYPPQSNEVHHEAELAVVMGRRARSVDEDDALDYVAGYTCANDVTARDIQRREGKFTHGKGFDTFCPIGPCLRTADTFDVAEHTVECRVDGDTRQSSGLDDFIFDVPTVLAFVSDIMTLRAGDVILTGTPAGVGPIELGDEVVVSIDGIGTLTNPVVSR